jgi:hypothetical protein
VDGELYNGVLQGVPGVAGLRVYSPRPSGIGLGYRLYCVVVLSVPYIVPDVTGVAL